MDPRNFLHQARTLAATNTAAGRRSATSRAYYATYHVALELLQALGFRRIERGHAGHQAVRVRLAHSRLDPVIHVSALLRQFHDIRVKADYWLRDPHPEHPATATHWLDQAETMVRTLDAVAADPRARARMTAAIAAWEQSRDPGTSE